MSLPNAIREREPIDPRLAVGSSLPNPKELFAMVFSLYIINEERDSLDYSIPNGNLISLEDNLILRLRTFFSDVDGYDESRINLLQTTSPLVTMQIEPLQVTLQLFWKLAKIKILDSASSSNERTGNNRYPKNLSFTTNMDILKSVLSNENNVISLVGKSLLYRWLFNLEINNELTEIENKLKKTLLIFSEDTLYKIWESETESKIFQQEGIYDLINSENLSVNISGAKETKGTLRNLKSFVAKNLHPFLQSGSDNFSLRDINILPSFEVYRKRVSNFLDLSPKSITIIESPVLAEPETKDSTDNTKTLNTIFYGAPGTGKSHKVEKILKQVLDDKKERVTFHPEFDNASFVGGYKPVSELNTNNGVEEIKYKFVAQAFTNIYIKAWKDLDSKYYLAIEEINRGNCAEIFGELFQLLDRNSNYSISPSKELKEYLIKELGVNHDGIKGGKMKLPPNLILMATMNTSDQSLFPMDSAFKRRWSWEYIPINYQEFNEDKTPNASFNYKVKLNETTSFKWIDFIKVVNAEIKSNSNLGMDKCIGNYFIKTNDNVIELEEFINKTIFYMWNDVFKDETNDVFPENLTYEDFFPIKSNGVENLKKIIEKLQIPTTTS